ncbi:MAG: ABC transporter substrate-binding protein [Spirochaetales bacterium]|jgi:branched-chain amino acid transport system substrate-binding protein|nr:ABC transporter substrate-binding protein [Spirochaetales bacterium]
MKKIFLAIAVVLLVSNLWAGGGKEEAAGSSNEPVRFLMSGMMSGPNAESGRQVRMAAETGTWYINEVLGGFKSLGGRKVEMIVVDSTSDAAQAAAPLEQALSRTKFSVLIGNPNSSIALVNQPIAEAFQIPQITSAAANIKLSQGGFKYTFQLSATPAMAIIPTQMAFLEWYAGLIGKTKDQLRLGVIFADDAWGTDNANATRMLFSENGYNVVFNQSYNIPTFTDATPLVTALRNAGVDVLMPSSYPSDLSLIFTAMGALNYKPLVVGGGAGMTWPSLYADLGKATDGITSVDGWVWDQTGAREHKGWQQMNDWYEKKFNEFLPGQGGPTLMSIMLAYAAIEKAGSDDPVKIRDALYTLNKDNCEWFTIPNGYGQFDPVTGQNVKAEGVMMQWQNGRPMAVFPPHLASVPILNPVTMQPFTK